MKNELGVPDILSRKEAAAVLGICLSTLDRLDIQRTKIGKRVAFKRDIICKWIDDHTEKIKKVKV